MARALTPVGVSLALDELRHSASGREDSGLAAIRGAAESVAARWLAQHERAEDCRRTYEEALRAEEGAAVQLDLVLRTLEELSAPEEGSKAPRAPAPQRVGWLQRLRRSGRAPSAPDPPDPRLPATPTIAASPPAVDEGAGEPSLAGGEPSPLGGEPPLIHGEATNDRSLVVEPPREDGQSPAPDPGAPADVAVHLLGNFRLVVRGRPLEDWQGAKSQRVIRYLMAHPRRPVPKDVLVDVFCPRALQRPVDATFIKPSTCSARRCATKTSTCV